eukprot:766890-Hanusia_phi.AAC.5
MPASLFPLFTPPKTLSLPPQGAGPATETCSCLVRPLSFASREAGAARRSQGQTRLWENHKIEDQEG